jgi:RHS repeat-associated protein
MPVTPRITSIRSNSVVIILLFIFQLLASASFAQDLSKWLKSPNGGEYYQIGATINLTIDGNIYTPGTVVVEMYNGATKVYGPSYGGVTGRTISTTGFTSGTNYKVKIYDASNSSLLDWSDATFSLGSSPTLTNWLITPNGGGFYSTGTAISVGINGSIYAPANVSIELYKGATKVYGPNTGGISGRTIPTTGLAPGIDYRVRIFNASNTSEQDWSDNYFTISTINLASWLQSPNGGESFVVGSTINLSINSGVYNPSAVTVELYKGYTKVFGPATAGISGRTISTTGLAAGSDYRVRIYDASNAALEDWSNSYFTVVSLSNWVTTPNGGESYPIGKTIDVSISSVYSPASVGMELYKGATKVYGPTTGGITGRTIPTTGLTAGTDYKVRIYNVSDPTQEDWSNANFSIVSLAGWLQSPNGDDFFTVGSTINLTINGSLYSPATTVVELFKGATKVWGPSYAGVTNRTIPTTGLTAGADYRVHIYDASTPTLEDWSDNYFTLGTSLSGWLSAPNGGGVYPIGSPISLTINNGLYNPSAVTVELYKGATKVFGPSTAGITGRTISTKGLTAGSDYKVRIYNASNSAWEDWSDANFSLVSLSNWVTTPNGGESYPIGKAIDVSISSVYSPASVGLELYKGATKVYGPTTGGITGRTIPTTGLAAGTDYKVRIYNVADPNQEDWSNATFSLVSLAGWLQSPNGGEFVTIGSTINLTINGSLYTPGTLVVEMYKGSTLVSGPSYAGVTGRSISTTGLSAGTDYRVRIYDYANPSLEDWSDNYLTLGASLGSWLTTPNGGEVYPMGSTISLNINSNLYNPSAVTVELYRGSLLVFGPTTAGISNRTISTVGLPGGGSYKVRIYNASNPVYEDWSDVYFSIVSLNSWVTTPNGGESYPIGKTINVSISSVYSPASVGLELHKGATKVYGPTTGGITGRTIPTTGLAAGTDYKIRIYNEADPTQEDWSNASFSIFSLDNWLQSPNGGETFMPGTTINLTINGSLYNPPTTVVELYKDATKVWGPSYAGTTNRSIPTTGLVAGADYKVRIYDANDQNLQDWSDNYLTIAILPDALPASQITSSSFYANWTAVPGATTYELIVSKFPDFSTVQATYTGLSSNTRQVTGLTGGTVYYYKVRAVNSLGTGLYGTPGNTTTLLSPPSGLAASNIQQFSFTISWSAVNGATSYVLDVATNSFYTEKLSDYTDYSLTGTSLNITGLSPSKTYHFRVKAINSNQASEYSYGLAETLYQFEGLNENYIVVHEALVEDVWAGTPIDSYPRDKVSQTVQYFDGLGRPIQTVSTQASPSLQDMVQPIRYDQYGRETKKYLPYTDGSNGWIKTGILDGIGNYMGNAADFYANASKVEHEISRPYSETILEKSPLNRPLKDYGPGSAWYANSKFVGHDYLVNVHGNTNSDEEQIIVWGITSTIIDSKRVYLVVDGNYHSSNSLVIQSTTDEQGHVVRTYLDKLGRTILKKVQVADAPSTFIDNDWTLTYYVYDDLGRLRFVLPPEFNTKIGTYSSADNLGKRDMLQDWAFQYKYDEHGRMKFKQVPGADSVEFVYDQWDRQVLARDGNQKVNGKWSFIKYDALNRPIITGEFSSSDSQEQMVVNVNALTARNEIPQTGNVGYSLDRTYPASISLGEIYTITYYDDYSFISNLTLGSEYNFQTVSGYTQTWNDDVRGLSTGTKIRLLNSNNFLIAVSYYDERYRLIQSVGDDHMWNKNRTTIAYKGITSLAMSTLLNHGTQMASLTETDYDHAGRPLKTYLTMDGGPKVTTSKMEYNELGQLVDKKLHSTDNGTTYLQSVDYRYNIRGWLKSINNDQLSSSVDNDDSNDLFGMNLNYNQPVTINGTNTNGQFNGNISSVSWSTNNLVDPVNQKIYGYAYDNLNRLTLASYAVKSGGSWSADADMFNEQLDYDKNGNILHLNRTSLFAGAKTTIDQLEYKYFKGNRLSLVNDNSPYWSKNDKNPDYGFSEITQMPVTGAIAEYEYDKNGNLTSDLNKGITDISYNYLNKAASIVLTAGTIDFTYDAAGNKLKKTAGTNSSDYVGQIQYENGKLAFVMLTDGRAVKTGNGWNYEYFHKDHLGNTRMVFGYGNLVNEYKATMETQLAQKENIDFSNLTNMPRAQVPGMNHTLKSAQVPNPDRSAETNGYLSRPMGPAKLLQVHMGDTLNISAYAKYTTGTGGINTVIDNLVSIVTGAFNIPPGEAAFTAFNADLPGIANGLTRNANVPKAYLFYIIYNSTYTDYQFGYDMVSSDAIPAFEKLTLNVVVPAAFDNGFIYTYVINESSVPSASSVYFDDVTVRHWQTAQALQVTQVTEYYPFGLAINLLAYNKNSINKNDRLYNGRELQDDFELGWEDYDARMYMPEIGRWAAIDNLAEKMNDFSPYNNSLDNPVYFFDHTGSGPVAFVFYEIRGIVGLLEGLGITSALTGTIYFDVENAEWGLGSSISLGGAGGIGFMGGLGAGYNWQADKIEDLGGLGAGVGGVIAIPGVNFSVEWNASIPSDAILEPSKWKDGLSVGLPIPGTSFGGGGGVFFEGSYTGIKKFPSLGDAVNAMFDPTINALKKYIEFQKTYPFLLGSFLSKKDLKKIENAVKKLEHGKKVFYAATQSYMDLFTKYYNETKSMKNKPSFLEWYEKRNKRPSRASDSKFSEDFLDWWYKKD